VFGALVVAGLGNIRHKGRTALLMLIGLGVCMSGFSLSKSLVASCVLVFVAGVALISVFSLVTSLVQLITVDEMRGRVMSVYNVAFRGGMPIGSLVTGSLVPLFSAPIVLACNGFLLAAVALYFLLVHRRVARL
jgi:predicted MFS family arabinose efflux permease